MENSTSDLRSRIPSDARSAELPAIARSTDGLAGLTSGTRRTTAEDQLQSLLAEHSDNDHLSSALREILQSIATDRYLVGQSIGGYEIIDLLGEGGMGEVYLARPVNSTLDRVALKVIKQGVNGHDIAARFSLEQRLLQQLQHPNIAKFLDAGVSHDGRAYFVMEFVNGVPITEYCDHRRKTIADRVKLMASVCRAVGYAASRGVVHRDIKPNNVLVMEVDGEPVAKVIDFGLAKACEFEGEAPSIHTRALHWVGTIDYVSPEQAAAVADIDPRADVYSLGIILFELLTSSPPIERDKGKRWTMEAWRRRLLEDDIPQASERVANAPADEQANICRFRLASTRELVRLLRGNLDAICRMALARDRELRYASPNEFADDLLAHLSYRSLRARPVTVRRSTINLLHRNRQRLRAVATALAMVVAVGALTSLFITRKVFLARESAASRQIDQLQNRQAKRDAYQSIADISNLIRRANSDAAGQLRRLVEQSGAHSAGDEFVIGMLGKQVVVPDHILSGHTGVIISLDVAEGHGWVASGSDNGELILWEIGTGRRIHRQSIGRFEVLGVAFSPDERYLAIAGQAPELQVLETATWQVAFSIARDERSIRSLAWSPDGRKIAGSDFGGEFHVWDVESKSLERSIKVGNGNAESVAWSPLGTAVAVTCNKSGATLFDTQTWERIDPISQATVDSHFARFSPDGKFLAVGDDREELRILSTTKQIVHQTVRCSAAVRRLSFTPQFDLLVGLADGNLDVFRFQPTRSIWIRERTINPKLIDHRISNVVPVAKAGTVFVTSTGKNVIHAFDMHQVYGARLLPTERSPVALCDDQCRCVEYDVESKQLWITDQLGSKGSHRIDVDKPILLSCQPACCSSVSRVAIATQFKKKYQVAIADSSDGRLLTELDLPTRPESLAFAPDGTGLLMVLDDHTLRRYDLKDSSYRSLSTPASESPTIACWSPQGDMIAYGTLRSHRIHMVDARSFEALGSITTQRAWQRFAFSADGSRVAVGEEASISIWDVERRREIRSVMATDGEWVSLCFNDDASLIATLAYDGTLAFWNCETGQRLHATIAPVSRYPCMRFDGGRFLLGAYEQRGFWEYGQQ